MSEIISKVRSQDDLNLSQKVFKKKEVDRRDWVSRLSKDFPEIKELKERIAPLERVVSFGNQYVPRRKEIKETVTKKEILQLILQYLEKEGLKESRQRLEKVSKLKLDPQLIDMEESRLVELLRIPLATVDRIWDLTIADKSLDDEENLQDLEDILYDMGMLEEDIEASEDMNIWEEPKEDNIAYTSGPGTPLKAASLNQLVIKLTDEKDHDMEFQKTILMTYQSFTTPEKLMKKLIQRYNVPANFENKSVSNTIQIRTVNVMKKWLGGQATDLNEQHLETFKQFLDKSLKNTPNLYKQLQMVLQKKFTDGPEDKKKLVFNEPPPEPKVDIRTIFSPQLSVFDIDELEVARQMTIIEFDLFVKIKPSELLNQAWNKPKLRHRAQNVLAVINRFNEVSAWVSSMILREEKIRNRARIMTKFIKIAEQLRKLNNLSTLMAIIAGLNNSAVHRLKWTREETSRQVIMTLENLMQSVSSANSYKNYRQLLQSVSPPSIPYLGVYLTDLTFIDEGNSNYIKSPSGSKDLINFSKRKLVYGVISQLQQLQQTSYNLQPVHQLYNLLKSETLRQYKIDEKDTYKLSMLREPRDVDRSALL